MDPFRLIRQILSRKTFANDARPASFDAIAVIGSQMGAPFRDMWSFKRALLSDCQSQLQFFICCQPIISVDF